MKMFCFILATSHMHIILGVSEHTAENSTYCSPYSVKVNKITKYWMTSKRQQGLYLSYREGNHHTQTKSHNR